MAGFDHKEIEIQAQAKWAELKLHETDLSDESKEPYYLLVEFPYPSGDLHIGHWYAFAVTDIYARFLRMKGKNVLFPIGFDAFGLPAENAAIKHGADPAEWTKGNIERMRGQLASMGASFDWSKEVVACDPSYYQWTQWLFSKLFEHNLAYRAEASVKWCPKDQTVLANEQVEDGRCNRCGTEVVEKRLTQWFLKITEYADRLLKDLDALPWREEIKDAQRAWIGKSEGAYLTFPIAGRDEGIKVFTTRPDTLYGVTYVVIAPEHPLVASLIDAVSNSKEVTAYIADTAKKTERERSENKEKTGVELKGVSAINPVTHEEIPVFIADYVLASYGTGAVMAVPAHDERDYEFAVKMNLPMRQVITPLFVAKDEGASDVRPDLPFIERDAVIAVVRNPKDGRCLLLKWKKVAWHTFITGGIEAGQTAEEAARAEILEETGYKNLKLVRDLGSLHSKFYHPPKGENRFGHFRIFLFDLENEEHQPLAAGESDKHELLWVAPEEVAKLLTARAHQYVWKNVQHPQAYGEDGILANSGTFSGRDNREALWDIVAAAGGEKATQYRLRDWGVSRQRYWGCPIPIVYDPEGKPHAVPAEHLPWLLPTDVDFTPTGKASPLASSKELRERVVKIFGEGWTPECDTLDTFVDSSWYFARYLDPHDAKKFSDDALMKKWLPVNRYSGGSEHTTMHLLYARFFYKALYDLALVPTSEPFNERFNRGIILGPDGAKMSKSKGNVVNPDDMVGKYGADAVRLYLAFIGPYNEPGSYPWNLDGVASMRKFLERIDRLIEKNSKTSIADAEAVQRAVARTSVKVADDCDRFKFNTAIAALMTLLNEFEAAPHVSAIALQEFVTMLSPFAPHMAEYFFSKFSAGCAAAAPWPVADAALLTSATHTVVVQVAGKKRGMLELSLETSENDAVQEALTIPAVKNALPAGTSRVIYVPGRILNLLP